MTCWWTEYPRRPEQPPIVFAPSRSCHQDRFRDSSVSLSLDHQVLHSRFVVGFLFGDRRSVDPPDEVVAKQAKFPRADVAWPRLRGIAQPRPRGPWWSRICTYASRSYLSRVPASLISGCPLSREVHDGCIVNVSGGGRFVLRLAFGSYVYFAPPGVRGGLRWTPRSRWKKGRRQRIRFRRHGDSPRRRRSPPRREGRKWAWIERVFA